MGNALEYLVSALLLPALDYDYANVQGCVQLSHKDEIKDEKTTTDFSFYHIISYFPRCKTRSKPPHMSDHRFIPVIHSTMLTPRHATPLLTVSVRAGGTHQANNLPPIVFGGSSSCQSGVGVAC
ncbi:hypothetical protein RRG08_030330 [Elysia crispata]|uniref:Uncharacterized protein n=1 Tax=Elysia crispata TaxID=231223 RepID=A0AAE1CZW6_9GAST|nr:hypothetical protein RRG08_030330 [Elysia crispata]